VASERQRDRGRFDQGQDRLEGLTCVLSPFHGFL
ncbi:hypothetical protein V495_06745, partial [Pseudogymnoascus sp. VKM F-4514 (FW-929)]